MHMLKKLLSSIQNVSAIMYTGFYFNLCAKKLCCIKNVSAIFFYILKRKSVATLTIMLVPSFGPKCFTR